MGRRIRRLCAVAWLGAALACHGASSSPSVTPPQLDGVLVAKCAAVTRGPVCQVGDDREVRIFIPGGSADVSIRVDGHELATTASTGSEGRAFDVVVPAAASLLVVAARVGGELRAQRERLSDTPKPPAWLETARAQKAKGALDEALRTLEGAGDGGDDRVADVVSLRARIALARGERDEAIAMLESASRLHEERGELSQAADDLGARAYALATDGKHAAEAKATIARLATFANDYPEAGALARYYEVVLAVESGDPSSALAASADAQTKAERVGVGKIIRAVSQVYADALQSVGRAAEAYAILSHLEADQGASLAACERANLDLNLGWAAIAARESPIPSEGAAPDPVPPLRRAVQDYASDCSNPRLQASALVNLALAELEQGDVAAARGALAQARAVPSHPRLLTIFSALEAEGRIAAAEGNFKGALHVYESLAAQAAGVSRLDEEAAEEGRADALWRMGDRAQALVAIGRAEALLDEAASAIPAGEGRGAFWWTRARVARTKVELLLDTGRAAEALEAARSARAQILWSAENAARALLLPPDARARWAEALADYRRARDAIVAETSDDWSLTGDALAHRLDDRRARDVEARAKLEAAARALFPTAPRKLPPLAVDRGEVGLVCVPLTDSWVVFVALRGALRVARVAASTDPSQVARIAPSLIEAAKPEVGHARRLRVIPFATLGDVDFAALPFDGEPLVTRLAIEYPLDAGDGPRREDCSGPALVVADPTGVLPAARREGKEVAGAFDGGANVRLLVGSDATRSRVLDELARASSLHYAGHASYAGIDGWESALVLAGGEHLTVADVLGLPHAPARVVLSGCETGREGERGGPVGLGLADAFVMAGARAVVASTRRVSDATTDRLMHALYPALAETPDDLAFALQRAQLEVRRALPSSDWSAFRVFTR